VTERFQQVLPAERSNRKIDHHRHKRERQPFGTGPDDFCANAPEIDVVEEQRDQSDRDGQHDDGANVRSHASQGPSYYSAPSTAARSRRHYMLLLSDCEAPCKIHTFSSSQDRSCRSPHRFFKRRLPAGHPIVRAKSATSTSSATACSSSRAIASRPSTTCSVPAFPTRAKS